ncbi:MAG: hypothetical protein KF774_15725 [Planctomyces sp.]|nr:hypothetical protein [Planctomyces sp.]
MPRSARALTWLLIAAWVGMATWVWRSTVPVVPESVLDIGRRAAWFPGPPGTLLLHEQQHSAVRRGIVAHGPLSIYDARDDRIHRSVLTREDEILTLMWGDPPLAVVQRIGGVFVVNLQHGADVCRLRDAPVCTSARLVADRGVVVVDQEGAVAAGYDARSGELLWEAPGFRLPIRDEDYEGVKDHLLLFQSRQPVTAGSVMIVGLSSSTPRQLRNVRTGEILNRFGDLTGTNRLHVFPDSGLMFVMRFPTLAGGVNDDPAAELFDFETGERLWSGFVTWFPRFASDDREELRDEWWDRSSGALLAITWRPGTRGALAAPPVRPEGPVSPLEGRRVGAGRYTLRTFARSRHGLARWLLPQAQRWNLSWLSQQLSQTVNQTWLIDHEHGGRLGPFPDHPGQAADVPGGNEFVVIVGADERQLHRYRLPPRRNWAWLFGWGLLPPVALFALGWRWKLRGTSRSLSPGALPSPSAAGQKSTGDAGDARQFPPSPATP